MLWSSSVKNVIVNNIFGENNNPNAETNVMNLTNAIYRSYPLLFDRTVFVLTFLSGFAGFLVPSCMSVDRLIRNLKALREERRMLPCYK